MTSPLFNELKETWYRASQAFDTIKNMVANAIQQARDQFENAKKLLTAVELALKGEFEAAELEARSFVDEAQRRYKQYEDAQRLEAERLRLQLEALKTSAESSALVTAQGALEIAKNNSIAFKAAQAGLDVVKTVEGAVYETLDSMVKAAGSLCDIRVAKLNGTLTARKEEQKPFRIYLEGTLLKKEFKLDLDYTPGETGAFLKNMASAAIKEI